MIIRWVCNNCNKKWIYPVEKCIYCKGGIIKQKGERLKVVGITKVNIPSPMHPIVPYNVILLEDEHGNRMPKKTMKEYKIGDIYIEQKAKDKGAVAIVKKKYDVCETIREALGLINETGYLNPSNKNEKFLIKPSICVSAYPYQAATTNPDVVEAIISMLIESGVNAENIIVAEQGFIGVDVKEASKKSGIIEVCRKYNVQFSDISTGSFEEIAKDGFRFSIYKEALTRKVINVPVMKTNQQYGISGGVENLVRMADKKTQYLLFENDFDKMLPKFVNAIVSKSDFITIGDATIGMQCQGPTVLGEPAFLNLILASKDPVALDAVFCNITMLDIPSHVTGCSEIGIGKSDVKEIELVGNELDALRYPIKTPVKTQTAHPDIILIDGKACSGCFNSVLNLTSNLIGLRGETLKIAIGHLLSEDVLNDERLIVYGDCAINKLKKDKIKLNTYMSEKGDSVEQLMVMKKLLTTKGKLVITPIDIVKTKITKLVSKVIG